MPVLPISHAIWQSLRACKRAKSPPTGKELRIWPSRATKDGTWLDKLVEEGLLEVVSVDELPEKATAQEASRPVQFRTRYRLTALGEHAAEWGEYERGSSKLIEPEPTKGKKK